MATLIKRSLRDQLVDGIGSEIISGHLQPGDLLPSEDVLLARYDVSRTVLREAIHVLTGKGLLDARPKRGTLVRPRSDWNQLDPAILEWGRDGAGEGGAISTTRSLDELVEVRRIIEPAAAALAAQRASAADIERMSAACDAMASAGNDVEAFMEADLAFHVACLHAAKNDFLLPIAHAIRTSMMRSLRETNQKPDQNRAVSLPLHFSILEAIRNRDPEAASQAMNSHLNDMEDRRARAGRKPDRNAVD